MKKDAELREAKFWGTCFIVAFVLTCMLASCNTCHTRHQPSTDSIVWGVPEASWGYCDAMLDNGVYMDQTLPEGGSVVEYTNCGELGSDFEVVVYWISHPLQCAMVEAQVLTF